MKYPLIICAILFACCTPAAAAVTYQHATQWSTWDGLEPESFSSPNGIAVDSDGNVYVADRGHNRVLKFDPDGEYLVEWGDPDGQYWLVVDIAVDADGYVYVSDKSNRIQKFSVTERVITPLIAWGGTGSADGEFVSVGGIAVDGNGNVFVADTANHRIQKFSSSGEFLSKWGTQGSGNGQFNYPYDVAVNEAGTIYVADRNNHRVQIFNSNQEWVGQWTGPSDAPIKSPWGITTGGDGTVYLADEFANLAQVFDADGVLLAQWGGWGTGDGQFKYPRGIAVASDNSVFVVDSGNIRVQKFTRNSNFIPAVTLNVDPATIDEGSILTGSGSFIDPDMNSWTATVDYGDGSSPEDLLITGDKSFSLNTHSYADNGEYTVTVSVNDGIDTGTATTLVSVNNVAPSVNEIIVPLVPVKVGDPVNLVALFTDPGTADTHTAEWTWFETTTSGGIVTESDGSGSVSGSFTYTTAGIYVVSVTVTDDDGASTTMRATTPVVVYDPSAGFATGGGWFNSPEGAYPGDPGLTGKANFAFVSKYKKDATEPESSIKFEFKAAKLEFESTSNDWLVITDSRATYQGCGTVNGAGDYRFLLSVIDGSPDLVRIKIWKTDSETPLYDNQMGADEFAAPTMKVGGGNIVVHN